MTTIDYEAIRRTIAGITLTHGVGKDAEHACSIAALNIALDGKLSDELHPCMSPVVRRWVIRVQDAMPIEMMAVGDEHGDRWREALVLVAGSATRGPVEDQRLAMILGWMRGRLADQAVLRAVPTSARPAWDRMLTERSSSRSSRSSRSSSSISTRPHWIASTSSRIGEGSLAISVTSEVVALWAVLARWADAVVDDAAAHLAFWRRADPAKLLISMVSK